MPAELTRDEVAAVAALAHLQLDASELDLLARQLGRILAYAEEVQRVDTTDVPPTASGVADLSNVPWAGTAVSVNTSPPGAVSGSVARRAVAGMIVKPPCGRSI